MAITITTTACGGFAQRREAKIQAKYAKLKWPGGGADDPEGGQQLNGIEVHQLETESFTNCRLHSPVAPSTSLLSPFKCILLGALLLTLTSGISALPRRLHGRHLILPHHHHVHLRSAELVPDPILVKVSPAKRLSSNCPKHTMAPQPTVESIRGALDTVQATKEATQCLLEKWLTEVEDISLKDAISRYSLHKLDLDHPLRDDLKSVMFDERRNEMRFHWDMSKTATSTEDLPKILDSLQIVQHLWSTISIPKDQWEGIFSHISEKIGHNIYCATVAMNIEMCDISDYTYNKNHAKLALGLGLETLKLLSVIESKYKVILVQLEAES